MVMITHNGRTFNVPNKVRASVLKHDGENEESKDPYAEQKRFTKLMKKGSEKDYLAYYYSVPFRLRKKYGLPKRAN